MANDAFPSVHILYHHHFHHGTHAGYDQLSRYLGEPGEPFDGLFRLPPVRSLAAAYAWRRGYDFELFYRELSLGLGMLWQPRAVYHLLYGDFDGRFLCQYPGARRHVRLATFHLVPANINSILTDQIRRRIRQLDAAVVVARSQAAYFAALVGAGRVFFVPHGIDTTVFVPPENQNEAEESPVILIVGNMLRDFDVLFDVIRIFRHRLPRVRFVWIAGLPAHDPSFARFQTLDNFEYRTRVSEAELIRAYQQSRLLFLPMRDCTANNSLLEGMSCGCPIVVTDVGGVRDYVQSDFDGLVPPGNAEAAAATLLDMLADEPRRRRAAAANRRQALTLDWQVVARAMKRVYLQVWEART